MAIGWLNKTQSNLSLEMIEAPEHPSSCRITRFEPSFSIAIIRKERYYPTNFSAWLIVVNVSGYLLRIDNLPLALPCIAILAPSKKEPSNAKRNYKFNTYNKFFWFADIS